MPVAPGATLEEALGGGEDYELLLAVAEGDADTLDGAFEAAGLRPPWRLGRVVEDRALRRLAGTHLGRLGWLHQLG